MSAPHYTPSEPLADPPAALHRRTAALAALVLTVALCAAVAGTLSGTLDGTLAAWVAQPLPAQAAPWLLAAAGAGMLLAAALGALATAQRRLHATACALHRRAAVDAARLASVLDAVSDAVAVTDDSGRIVAANAALAVLLGRPAAALPGHDLAPWLGAPEAAGTDGQAEGNDAHRPAAAARVRGHGADGRPFDAELAWHRLPAPAHGRLAVLRNLGPALAARQALASANEARQAAEDRLAAVFAHAPLALVSCDTEGRIDTMNPVAEELLGCIAQVERGQKLTEAFFDGADREAMVEALNTLRRAAGARLPAKARRPTQQRQLHALRRDGSRVALATTLVTLHDADGQPRGVVLMAQDIGERLRLAEQLAHQAFHDSLTQLPNRRQLEQRLQQAVAQGRRNGQPFALLLLDLDRFQPVNETWGHAVGDAVLCEVARRLRTAVRDIDVVARLGDDEFVVLLSALTRLDDAPVVADKLLAAVAEPMFVGGRRVEISASVGVATWPDAGDDATALLRAASVAMADAKSAGRLTLRRLGLGT